MYKKVLIVFLLAAALLSGCGTGGGAGAQITGREWVLATLRGEPALAGTQVTLTLEGDQAGGSSGCNSYGGEYSLRGERLSFGNLAMTEMACMEEGVMEQETAYLQALSQVAGFSVEGERLKLQDAAGETVLEFR